MPIYEYKCKKCRASFEHLTATMAHADGSVECPTCHSRQTQRKISVFAVASADQSANAAPAAGGMCGCGRTTGSCGRA